MKIKYFLLTLCIIFNSCQPMFNYHRLMSETHRHQLLRKQEFIEKLRQQISSGDTFENLTNESPLLNDDLYDHPELLQQVIDRKANLEVIDSRTGETPLYHAIRSRNSESALLLLKAGANSNYKNINTTFGGRTPVTYAIAYGELEMIKILLQYSANPNMVALYGYKEIVPLMHACQQGLNPLKLKKNRKEIFEALLAHGADPEKKNADGQNALEYIKKQFEECVSSAIFKDEAPSLQKAGRVLVYYQTIKRLLANITVAENIRLPNDVIQIIMQQIFAK